MSEKVSSKTIVTFLALLLNTSRMACQLTDASSSLSVLMAAAA